jgi:hypothetical protein
VEFGATSQFERTADGSFTKHIKLAKATKKTGILSDGLRPVGGAALRQPEAGVAANGGNR